MEKLTQENFKELSTKSKPLVVDFWANWCGPCRMMAPNFEQVAGELSDKFIFAKCDIDANRRLSIEHNIESIPTIAIFKDGQEIARFMGFCTVNDLKNRLNSQN